MDLPYTVHHSDGSRVPQEVEDATREAIQMGYYEHVGFWANGARRYKLTWKGCCYVAARIGHDHPYLREEGRDDEEGKTDGTFKN